jgi:hypothetical protein
MLQSLHLHKLSKKTMKTIPRFAGRFFIIFLAIILAACGAPPTIRDSKVISQPTKKTERLIFVYRQSEMKTVSTYGVGSALQGQTGFYSFGKFLVEQAPIVFENLGIQVVSSKELDAKAPINIQEGIKDESKPADKILLLYATSGHASSSGTSTRVSYVFEAQLFEVNTRKVIWKASINTETLGLANFGRTVAADSNSSAYTYNNEYAKLLLNSVVKKLKEDKMI